MFFEKYYPGQNYVIIEGDNKGIDINIKFNIPENLSLNINYANPSTWKDILSICKKRNVDKIVLHSAYRDNVLLTEYLKSQISCKVYWIFWGYELYNSLGEDYGLSFCDEKFNLLKIHTYFYPNRFKKYLRRLIYGYNLVDVLKKATEICDYFCFWNKYDYDLYTKYFGDKVKFKLFAYGCSYRNDGENEVYEFPEKRQSVIINHQASKTGNHFTLMKKMKEIDPESTFDIYMPLSYGTRFLRNQCIKMGYNSFGNKFHPITEYLPKEEYFSKINSAQVALFGQKRQEATGNIGRMLIVGTKVFLREENLLLKYYRDKGYLIYSMEKDLTSIDSLSPLTKEQMVHNKKVWYNTRLYYDDFMPNFFSE